MITYSAFLIGIISAFLASYLGFKRERRNPNIFIEHIGLRYPKNQSLTEAAKKKTGLGSSLYIDISNYYNQGLLVSNKQALDYSLACFEKHVLEFDAKCRYNQCHIALWWYTICSLLVSYLDTL